MYATVETPPCGVGCATTDTSSHPSSPNEFKFSPGLCSSNGATKYSHLFSTGSPSVWVFGSVFGQQPLADLADAHPHDHIEPARGRDGRGLFAHDVLLEPQNLRADRDGVDRHRRRVLGAPEHVDHVDREITRCVAQRRVRGLAEHLRLVGIHRDDPVAVPLEVARDLKRRPPRLGGQADHRDRVHIAQQRAELPVLRGQVTAHGAALRTSSRSARTMKPVAPHTVVSPSTYHPPRQVMPFSSRSTRSSSMAASSRSGTRTTRAIPASLTVSAGSAASTATNGVTRMPLT